MFTTRLAPAAFNLRDTAEEYRTALYAIMTGYQPSATITIRASSYAFMLRAMRERAHRGSSVLDIVRARPAEGEPTHTERTLRSPVRLEVGTEVRISAQTYVVVRPGDCVHFKTSHARATLPSGYLHVAATVARLDGAPSKDAIEVRDESILDFLPAGVQYRVRRAVEELERLSVERDGYRRLGMGDRYAEDLDVASAPHREVIAEFRACCTRKRIDADEVLALFGGAA